MFSNMSVKLLFIRDLLPPLTLPPSVTAAWGRGFGHPSNLTHTHTRVKVAACARLIYGSSLRVFDAPRCGLGSCSGL